MPIMAVSSPINDVSGVVSQAVSDLQTALGNATTAMGSLVTAVENAADSKTALALVGGISSLSSVFTDAVTKIEALGPQFASAVEPLTKEVADAVTAANAILSPPAPPPTTPSA